MAFLLADILLVMVAFGAIIKSAHPPSLLPTSAMPIDIRPAIESDLETLTEIYNHYVVSTAVTFDTRPFTPVRRRNWFGQFNRNPRHVLLVACKQEQVIGYASSSQFRRKSAYDLSVETTIYLDPVYAGQGIGTELYALLMQALQTAKIHRCYAIVTLPNDASIALHKSMGFTKIGVLSEVGYKFGKYWDTAWMEKTMGGRL